MNTRCCQHKQMRADFLKANEAHHAVSRHLSAVPSQHPKVQSIPQQHQASRGCKGWPQKCPYAAELQHQQRIPRNPHPHTDLVDAQKVGVYLHRKEEILCSKSDSRYTCAKMEVEKGESR